MAKKKSDDESTPSGQMLRAPAETLYAAELDQLNKDDKHDRPPGWRMSARAVLTYICGGKSGEACVHGQPCFSGGGEGNCVSNDSFIVTCAKGIAMALLRSG